MDLLLPKFVTGALSDFVDSIGGKLQQSQLCRGAHSMADDFRGCSLVRWMAGWVGVALAYCKIHLTFFSHQHIKCTIYNVRDECYYYFTHIFVMVDKKEQNTYND